MRSDSSGLRYYHRGQQYSITALTDSNGNVTERYAYTAYGTPAITDGTGATLTTSVDSNRYTYTGREWDETLSLYHYRARMYDAISGRFLGRDPIGYWDDRSLYANAFGLAQVDPAGLHRVRVTHTLDNRELHPRRNPFGIPRNQPWRRDCVGVRLGFRF